MIILEFSYDGYFLKYIFINYDIIVVPIFPPLPPSTQDPPFPPAISPLSSCPWSWIWVLWYSISYTVLNIPCLFCTYHLCFLFPVPFPPFSPTLSLLITFQMFFIDYNSVSVLLVCLICFLDSIVEDCCEFLIILMLLVLIFFFFLK